MSLRLHTAFHGSARPQKMRVPGPAARQRSLDLGFEARDSLHGRGARRTDRSEPSR